jgi:phosphoesterase RecJ-like protein
MKYSKEFKKAKKYIKNSSCILFVPHVDPDPDALCACNALQNYIQNNGKKSYIGLQGPLFSKYNFIFKDKVNNIIQPKDFNKVKHEIDLIIALDIGVRTRGGTWTMELKDIPIINMDHHIDNDHFGDINVVDDNFSSTCEIVYEFFKANKIKINREIAVNIYTGIVYDTGSFRYSLTTKKTHKYVGEITDKFDFDRNDIYEKLFENKKVESLCLQTKVFNSLKIFNNGKIAVTWLDKSGYDECNANEDDAIELVRVGSSIQGVDFSIFIHEKPDKIKVSLRSKSNFNVNKIARQYGGGGHVKASGFSMSGTVKQVYDDIVDDLIGMYKQYENNGKT